LLNPVLIVEVLSDSTEAYDRGRKFEHYRKLESLMEYVLIASIARMSNPTGGNRSRLGADGKRWLEGRLRLDAIDCELALVEIYDKVEFSGAG